MGYVDNQRQNWFISAGEVSGDIIASGLVEAAHRFFGPDSISFFGICGPKLENAGVEKIIDMHQLNVMGLGEILSHLPRIAAIEQEILESIEKRNPQVCILVDFPGFHFRLAKRLRLRGHKVIQYVAPKVWAWGQGRVKRLRRDFDLVLGILPFEAKFFREHGVSFQYIGSPHLDRVENVKELDGINQGSMSRELSFAILPGSRRSEVRRIAPVLGKICEWVLLNASEKIRDHIRFRLPVAEGLSGEFIEEYLLADLDLMKASVKSKVDYYRGQQSLSVMKSCSAAVVTSGTATLECGLLGTPMAVVYKMNPFSFLLAKLLVKVRWISLVNLSLSKSAVPEFIQSINVSEVGGYLLSLLDDESDAYREQRKDLQALSSMYKALSSELALEKIQGQMLEPANEDG